MNVDLEVLDGFIDGEDVDVLDVKDALATADGRDYLVDAWVLRQAVKADPPAVSEAPIGPAMSSSSRQTWLVAAGIAASLVIGFYAGRLGGDSPDPVSVQVEAPAPMISPAAATGPFPVPAATRVIRLEFNSPVNTTGGD